MIEREEFLEKIIWDWRMIIFIEWVPNALKTAERLEWQKSLIRDSSINPRAQRYCFNQWVLWEIRDAGIPEIRLKSDGFNRVVHANVWRWTVCVRFECFKKLPINKCQFSCQRTMISNETLINDFDVLNKVGTRTTIHTFPDVCIPSRPTFNIATWLNHVDRMILEIKSINFECGPIY
jgi:hypothetical protein